MRGPILDVRGTTAVQSLALSNISLLAVGQRGLFASREGAMAPVGPLYFVARHANAWIMAFYILATSFVTFVDWTDLGTGLDGDGAISSQTMVS